jgi:hypothetical protein
VVLGEVPDAVKGFEVLELAPMKTSTSTAVPRGRPSRGAVRNVRREGFMEWLRVELLQGMSHQ